MTNYYFPNLFGVTVLASYLVPFHSIIDGERRMSWEFGGPKKEGELLDLSPGDVDVSTDHLGCNSAIATDIDVSSGSMTSDALKLSIASSLS